MLSLKTTRNHTHETTVAMITGHAQDWAHHGWGGVEEAPSFSSHL